MARELALRGRNLEPQYEADAFEPIEFRPSTRSFLFKSGLGWITLAATIPLFFITIPLIGYIWLCFVTSYYRIDQGRLFIRTGIIFRSEDEIELFRVKDVAVDFSIIQQMFDCGTIRIISSDHTGRRVTGSRRFENECLISHVPGARAIREDLRQRVMRSRRRTGTREID